MTRFNARLVLGVLVVLLVSLASVQPASAAVPGLQRITAVSDSNSLTTKSATANCPAGKQVIGTGARISGGQGQVVIDDITPDATLSSVFVTGNEDADGFAGNWTVSAIAICANPLPGQHRVSLTNGPDSVDPKTAHPECPGSQQVIGQGADITGGAGRVTLEVMPGPFAGSNNSFATAVETFNGTSVSWSITSHLICVNSGLPGLIGNSDVTEFTSQAKTVSTSCGTSRRVVGTGFSIVQGSGQALLSEIVPSADLTSVQVSAVEDQDGHPGVWSLRAFALCATP